MDDIQEFTKDLAALINRHSMEQHGGNTPDFVLASVMVASMLTFGHAVENRDALRAPATTKEAETARE